MTIPPDHRCRESAASAATSPARSVDGDINAAIRGAVYWSSRRCKRSSALEELEMRAIYDGIARNTYM
ncbi:MAG TPA: hypothetical protein VFQ53_33065 [Kofleriaceae bacterium]|nr:hypothetical protein [Kofleriaceae bacterium]